MTYGERVEELRYKTTPLCESRCACSMARDDPKIVGFNGESNVKNFGNKISTRSF